MQFVKHISNNEDSEGSIRIRDRRPLHDVYVRRYYNTKYALETLGVGGATWAVKTLLENLYFSTHLE